jgi:GNAT superfamily N-acetyltransferase
MAFRRLTNSDYLKYHDLINEFRQTTFTEEMFVKKLESIQASSVIWVYEENDVLLATGTIIYEHKFIFDTCIYAHIEDVCVRKTHRRKGLGKLLMRHLMNQARHCYKVTLDCADENVQFYKTCGLEPRGNQMCQLISNLSLAPLLLTPRITASDSPFLSANNTGLGNVMFQIASCYGLAKKTGRKIVWNNVALFADKLKGLYDFNHKDTIFRNFLDVSGAEFKSVHEQNTYGYSSTLVNTLETANEHIELNGYLECVDYFKDYKKEILELFSIDDGSMKFIKDRHPILFDEAYTTVSIHFRGNECVTHPGIGIAWDYGFYRKAAEHFKTSVHNPIFLIFSDDMERIDFSFLGGAPYIKMSNPEDYIDMWCITLCKHNIISHSTFSFWTAYMNKNPGAIILYNWNNAKQFNAVCGYFLN